MADYQHKYLRVQRKSDRIVIKRIDVGHLNKVGRALEWAKLDDEFPPSEYVTCYETSQSPLPVFFQSSINDMNHLGLFEGIGGFSLAAREAGWDPKAWVEIEPYCQLVLQKNFPEALGFADVKEFNYATYKSILRARGDRDRRIDCITGGFPCQPYSEAGKQRGNSDDRAIWPQMLRVIKEIRPTWVVGENVAGLVRMDGGNILAGILSSLEEAGYETSCFIIPAIGLGAPHKRQRIWIVGYSADADSKRKLQQKRCYRRSRGRVGDQDSITEDTISRRLRHREDVERLSGDGELGDTSPGVSDRIRVQSTGPDTGRISSQRDGLRAEQTSQWPSNEYSYSTDGHTWKEDWVSVATRVCRVDDGIPGRVDGPGQLPAGTPIKKAAGRGHRLKALGNSIVWQIPYQIFNTINRIQNAAT